MKKKTTHLLVCCIIPLLSSADVGVPFWHETFNAGFPTSWSTDDASGQGVVWTQCDDYLQCPPATLANLSCSDPLFRSTGFEDGYIYVNSFGAGVLAMPSQSYLRTSPIDCTNQSSVFIAFETYLHAVYNNPDINAVLRVKSGNGPWQVFPIFPGMNLDEAESIQSFNAQPVLLDISSVAANQPNIFIEWRWNTNFDVAWMIDDVALFDQNPMMDNVVWGQTPGSGDFDGGLNGWSVLNNQLDTCEWVWVNSRLINLPDSNPKADAIGCWSGIDNGAMMMNAAYCNRYGLPSLFSRSDLQSPEINLAGVQPGTRLNLKFNQIVSLANAASTYLPKTSVAISVDNGLTFLDTIEVNPLLPYFHAQCGEVSVRLPQEVAGKPKVRVRFLFSGDANYWMVDDVRIAHVFDNDLAINPAFYNVAPDRAVPATQIRPINLYAQVRNEGNLPIATSTAHVEVKNSNSETVFRDSVLLATLHPDDEWFDLFFPNKFTPAPQPEKYQVFYRITANPLDENPKNDRVYWQYDVTEDVFSKNDFCSTSLGYFRPASSEIYEIGNCYYIPQGGKIKAKSVSFAFKNVAALANSNAVLNTNLYRWRKNGMSGDVNGDTLANVEEYELIASNNYDVTGAENNKVVTVPISFETDPVYLQNETYYFVTVGYKDLVYQNGQAVLFSIGGSEEVDYTAMFYNSYQDGIPAYTSMLREGDDLDFTANAWALRRIPFVNLNVENGVNSIPEVEDINGSIHLSPNPADEFVWLTTDFPSELKQSRVEIFDICGRLAVSQELESESVSQLPIAVGELRNGTYTLRVIAGDRIFIKKLLIVH